MIDVSNLRNEIWLDEYTHLSSLNRNLKKNHYTKTKKTLKVKGMSRKTRKARLYTKKNIVIE